MDVCSTRPLLVTAGVDKTVRLWNLVDKTCRLVTRMSQEVSVVALHPSGFYLLVRHNPLLRPRHLLMMLRAVHSSQRGPDGANEVRTGIPILRTTQLVHPVHIAPWRPKESQYCVHGPPPPIRRPHPASQTP